MKLGRTVIIAVLFGLIVGACGGDGATDTTQPEAPQGSTAPTDGAEDGDSAQAAVDAACEVANEWKQAPSEWRGPTESPTPPDDVSVALVSVQEITEGSARATRAQKEAAEALGWQADIFDGEGTTEGALTAINAAVDAGYDAITLTFIDPSTVSEAVNRALDAEIPVATLGVPEYTDARADYGEVPDISHDWYLTGEIIGNYMICRSEGQVDALMLNGAETDVVLHGQYAGSEAVLSDPEKCPDCETQEERFAIATIDTQTAELAVGGVQANPDLNWIWCYDFCMAQAATRLVADGLDEGVMGAGFDCNAQNIQLIRDGQVQVVCIADPRNWLAWGAIDNVNRLLNGEPAVTQEIPVRLFDDENVDDFTEEDVQEGWQGGFDFQSEYLRLWGVES